MSGKTEASPSSKDYTAIVTMNPSDGHTFAEEEEWHVTVNGETSALLYRYDGYTKSFLKVFVNFGLLESEDGTSDGIADVVADAADAEVVGNYTVFGQKLAEEPASGVFLVVFSNGKTVKIVK